MPVAPRQVLLSFGGTIIVKWKLGVKRKITGRFPTKPEKTRTISSNLTPKQSLQQRCTTDNKMTHMSSEHAQSVKYDREAAWELLTQWTQGESLRKHALGVEACVVAYAEVEADRQALAGSAREQLLNLYSTTALLHDFDYERHPSLEEHPFVGVRELARLGWPQETQTAILGHATYSGVLRESHLARVLFACDELSGFLTACALVKPSRAIADVEAAGVRKKLKDKAFARGVSRQDVLLGAEELGIELETHIAFCLAAMQQRASSLGL